MFCSEGALFSTNHATWCKFLSFLGLVQMLFTRTAHIAQLTHSLAFVWSNYWILSFKSFSSSSHSCAPYIFISIGVYFHSGIQYASP
ncbi:metal tolerance protein C4-like protein [Corchorus olitorius]|uniref:Metal tolerance protein C4-like protein n=1 Tax=Corchorus olitorius TaxID=93759 RepID=A0A1R3JAM5_9ROSI|nr:metal tolerance protein C4-like protein [Corchorus olitorius]